MTSMTTERDECRMTVDGVAPSVVTVLQAAIRSAASMGRNWVGVEDLLDAVLSNAELDGHAPAWWPRSGKARITREWSGGIGPNELNGETEPLTYEQMRGLVREWVPGPTPGVGPSAPANVTFELTGPHAEEFRRMIGRA